MPTPGGPVTDATTQATVQGVTSRDAYHHGDLRTACIEAALRLVEDGGPEAVTIRGVARVAGVSHQAPLHHFRDRDALLHEVAERGFELLVERLDRELHPGTSPLESLRTYGVVYVLHAVEHPGLFQVMFAPCDDPPGEAAYRRLIELCAGAQAAGELRGDDPLRLGLLVWSTVHGLAALYGHMGLDSGASGQPTDPRLAAERTLDDLIAGLAGHPSLTRRSIAH
jgi:AcrR family transcriptional regulator